MPYLLRTFVFLHKSTEESPEFSIFQTKNLLESHKKCIKLQKSRLYHRLLADKLFYM